ncbi:MAG: hypothetical protein PHD48_08125 [Alphaproteobacteria bacterium]|nr:hypothetical protein [Alphaproteobacteria bacterium]
MTLPVTSGVVKTTMLPGICVSFSNSPELAARDIASFADAYPQGTGFANTVAHFERASANSENEYLIAFAKHAKLVKISNGIRSRSDATTQWIGDAFAYDRFREYEKRLRQFPEAGRAINAVMFADEIKDSPASDLYSTMRRVISDRDVLSVGGFAYVLSDRLEHFRQSAYCDMFFDWPRSAADDFNLDLNDQIDFGASGENCEFTVVQASPSYMGLNLAVFYVLAAKKVFVFGATPDDPIMRCRVLSNVEPLDISSRLEVHFGKDWGWLMQVMSASPRANTTSFRDTPITSGPSGVRFGFLCHLNTFNTR